MAQFPPMRPDPEEQPERSPESFLRIVRPDDSLEPLPPESEEEVTTDVTPNIRLSQFYRRWFLPIVIEGEGLSGGTAQQYESCLAWWRKLTSDPPLRLIDQFVIATFAAKLRKATYRRGPLGAERPLGEHRANILLRCLRALLARIGPQREHRKPTAELVRLVPAVPISDVDGEPKPPFSLDEAQRIIAAAARIDRPQIEGIEPYEFWRGLLSWAFVTGLRRGSLLALQWTMLRLDGKHWWLNVPAELVEKTGKAKRLAMPAWAMQAVERWPRSRSLIFPWPHDVDHLNDVHYHLQTLAAIPEDQQLSIQAWRRTHAQAMGSLGFHEAKRLAQMALDHSDGRTTSRFYVDFENQFRLKLPPLFRPDVDDGQKRLF